MFLVLDGVTDPHNLGACLRSAAAANVTAVVVPKDRAVGITPVVRRASAGAADRVPFVAATNLARALRTLKESGVWLTGLAGDAPTSIYDIELKGPAALVLGGETLRVLDELYIYPAKHFVTPEERVRQAVEGIRGELQERLGVFKSEG